MEPGARLRTSRVQGAGARQPHGELSGKGNVSQSADARPAEIAGDGRDFHLEWECKSAPIGIG